MQFQQKENLWKSPITVHSTGFFTYSSNFSSLSNVFLWTLDPVIILSINANLNTVLRLRNFLAQEAHRLHVPRDTIMKFHRTSELTNQSATNRRNLLFFVGCTLLQAGFISLHFSLLCKALPLPVWNPAESPRIQRLPSQHSWRFVTPPHSALTSDVPSFLLYDTGKPAEKQPSHDP